MQAIYDAFKFSYNSDHFSNRSASAFWKGLRLRPHPMRGKGRAHFGGAVKVLGHFSIEDRQTMVAVNCLFRRVF